MAGITCFTAPGIMLTDRAALHEHYRSEWHRYNLKRKVAGLAPLSKADFDARKAAALAARAEQARDLGKQDHVKENKKEKVSQRKQMMMRESIDSLNSPPSDQQQEDASRDGETEGNMDMEVEISPNACLFDNTKHEDVHSALDYMRQKYGFMIPDVEYLVDLTGLVEYLHEKVRLGNCCLYCERTFRTTISCQQHMIDKSHCKIKYDDEADMDEFAEFYDFSSTYTEDGAEDVAAEDGGVAMDEEGGDEMDEDDLIGKNMGKIEMLPGGEMLITRRDGTTKHIGVRWLRRYYNQNARLVDERESVLAAQKERLLLIYRQAGVDTESVLAQRMKEQMLVGAKVSRRTLFTGTAQHSQMVSAKRHFRAMNNARMKVGMTQNWLAKHQIAKQRMRGEGVGVHG